jgi:hypothetical protein
LRQIIAVAFIAVVLVFGIGLLLSVENEVQKQWSSIATRKSDWVFLHLAFAAAGDFLTFFAPTLAVFGTIVGWVYQVGAARLGVIDLFACEIATLCRVAMVVETVQHYAGKFEQGPPAAPASTGGPRAPAHPPPAQGNYFPVFASNVRDLQMLEARVVINITAFYTYMTAARDMTRDVAEIRPQPGEFASPHAKAATARPWHEAMRNIVYMLFLGLESARNAINDLVEFEPGAAEHTIIILTSELTACRFLCRQFTDPRDVRHRRIMLRAADYQRLVPQLCGFVEARRASERTMEAGEPSYGNWGGPAWQPACVLLPELQEHYQATIAA